MSQDFTALIPMKRLGGAKTRLDGALSADARADLALDMFVHVINTVRATPSVADVYVVTSDPAVSALAWEEEADVLADHGGGLNSALEEGIAILHREEKSSLVIVQGDLPWLTASALDALLAATPAAGAALATDHHGSGTSALAWRGRPGLTRFAFGEDSASRHAALAQAAGLPFHLVTSHPAFRDVDSETDLAAFARQGALEPSN